MFIRIADIFARQAGLIILLACLLVGVVAARAEWTKPIDHGLEKARMRLFERKVSGETVVIEIDARSLREVHSWPWPRSIHGKAVDKLNAAGARQIAFDVDFTSPASDPKQDIAFAAAIKRASGKIILPGTLENAEGILGKRMDLLPSEPLRRHARLGAIWISLDADDLLVRRIPYSVSIAGLNRPSLATILADQRSESAEHYEVDWSFDINSFPSLSYADVLEGRFPRDFFRGKNVVIGATAASMGDRWSVPRQGRIPGVYVQAIGSETLRRGQPVPLGTWPLLALTCAMIGISMLLRRRLFRFAAVCACLGIALLLPILVRESSPMILEAGPAVLAGGLALLLTTIAAAAQGFVSRVTLAPVSQLPNLTAMCIAAPEAQCTVAVRLRNHIDTTALLGTESQGELLRKVCDRLSLAAGGADIFQVDDHSFAWRTADRLEAAAGAVEGLHALFASGIPIGGRTVDATIAIGICDDPTLETEAAVAAAMVAANRADRRGVNWERFVADEEDDDGATWRLSLLNELDRAIDQGDVWVAYQPKYDLKSRDICGAEALIRWSHPQRGPIPPDAFIRTLEENGRIEKLTLHVLRTAIFDFAPLDRRLSIAVNISARMIGRNRLIGPIRAMLAEAGMKAKRLTLEITESAALAGSAGIEELNNLRALGVNISIDDYGTGQSTLSYMKTLPASELKIDQSFVRLISTSRSDAAVVDSTVKLAHALGLVVVAEGVESEDVAALLKRMDCDMIQGFYIGKPVPFETFVANYGEKAKLRVA